MTKVNTSTVINDKEIDYFPQLKTLKKTLQSQTALQNITATMRI